MLWYSWTTFSSSYRRYHSVRTRRRRIDIGKEHGGHHKSEKRFFFVDNIDYFEHTIRAATIKFAKNTTNALRSINMLTIKIEQYFFFGSCNIYRQYSYSFSKIPAAPTENLWNCKLISVEADETEVAVMRQLKVICRQHRFWVTRDEKKDCSLTQTFVRNRWDLCSSNTNLAIPKKNRILVSNFR